MSGHGLAILSAEGNSGFQGLRLETGTTSFLISHLVVCQQNLFAHLSEYAQNWTAFPGLPG